MRNENKQIMASALEKLANMSIKAAANSRCMYIVHQPKMPEGIKDFVKK